MKTRLYSERTFVRYLRALILESTSTRGGHTQAEITRAAYRLFVERGYHGTSMRDIAREAGTALGGIYNHFASKEDIFLTVFVEHHPYRDILPAMSAAQGETIEQFVRDAAARMVEALGENQDFLNLTFIELVEFKGRHIPLLFGSIFPRLLEFARRMVAGQGELRLIPIPILLRAFLGLFFSFYMTELLIGKQLPDDMQQNALDHFVDIFLHGILIDSKDYETTPVSESKGLTNLDGL